MAMQPWNDVPRNAYKTPRPLAVMPQGGVFPVKPEQPAFLTGGPDHQDRMKEQTAQEKLHPGAECSLCKMQLFSPYAGCMAALC